MIVWDQVSVSYSEKRVLGPVSVSIEEGQWVGLIGPNGAGKSTMLKVAVGLVEKTGEFRLSNGNDRHAGRDIAWMPQRPTMPEHMGVADYVMLGRSPHIGFLGVEGPADHRSVGTAIARLDLDEFARRPLGTLSGGEAQRAVLARALAQEAPILLLDEPTANLDVGHAVEVMEVIGGLTRDEGLTVVTAIHDLTLAGRFCERLVLLGDGVVMADGTPAEVLTESKLRPHYGDTVRVISDVDGPLVVPGRKQSE